MTVKDDLITKVQKIARKKVARIVVCEGWDERCLQASALFMKDKLGKIILLGNPDTIKKKAKELKADISKAEIVDYKKSKLKKELAQKLYELRKAKGLTLEDAEKLIENENYFGCMYAYSGYADAVGGSAICPTGELMRPALQILRDKGALCSEIMLVYESKKDRVLFMSDTSLNIDPNSEQLCQIALNAADAAEELEIEPRIALLSFSTKGSGGDNPQTQVVRDALSIAKKKRPKLIIDGEMQVDASVNPYAAGRKCPNSPLKGNANILIFPNLTAGNICMHALLQFSELEIMFSEIRGVSKPVGIFGRSFPMLGVRNILMSLAMEVNAKG